MFLLRKELFSSWDSLSTIQGVLHSHTRVTGTPRTMHKLYICCRPTPQRKLNAMHDCRACSVLASLQDAQVRAAQALHGLVAIINRSGGGARTQAASTQAVSQTLACFQESLKAVTITPDAEHPASHGPWLLARHADHALCRQAAQVGLCHMHHQFQSASTHARFTQRSEKQETL